MQKYQWKKVARGFEEKWNFPHCIGAIDGKHVVIQAPANSGSMFFNYKKSFSIVLLAVCNSNYEFSMVDIGGQGNKVMEEHLLIVTLDKSSLMICVTFLIHLD